MKFNRYWISDRSGHGVEKWIYLCGDFESTEGARHHIIHQEEMWAIWAESYSMDIELDVVPPTDFLEKEFDRACGHAAYALQRVEELRLILGHSQGIVL